MAETTTTVAVMKIGSGKVHAGVRSANGEGWGSLCSGRYIGPDHETLTESPSHINCARCAAKLGKGA